MSVYRKVATAFTDSIIVLDKTTRAPVLNLVQADFDLNLSKDGVGGQPVAGLVLTEVDQINNPGEYAIAYDPVLSFVAATGYYTLDVVLIADDDYNYSQSYWVTSDGSGAGTVGAAAFTATAGDGRVTDGILPLEGVEIRIRQGSTILWMTETDAAGVWGPVYLDNGVYTIDAQLAGYSLGTGLITVALNIATGPGADIVLTAVSSGTGLTANDLWAYARRMFLDSPGPKADIEIKQAVNDALDMVSKSETWPWYLTAGKITTRPFYNTGAIDLTEGSPVVNLTGGVFPTWVVGGELLVNNQWYPVLLRNSPTQITLASSYGKATQLGVAYVVYQDAYEMPPNCMKFGRLLYGTSWQYGGNPTSYQQFLDAKNLWQSGQQGASLWCVQKNYLRIWPYPSLATDINFSFYRKPLALTVGNQEADWDPNHVGLLRRATDYQLAVRGRCAAGDTGTTMAAFSAELALCQPMDRTESDRAPLLGPSGGGQRYPRAWNIPPG